MFSFTEFRGESDYDRRHRGTIEIQGEYVARRKPAWLVVGKLAIAMFVIGFAYALCLIHIDYPGWKTSVVFFGVLLLYCGIAYMVRPNPNDMNMGWGGGLMNDPTQYSDNINRGLRDLECILQPGQLVTESVLDLFILLSWHRAYEPPEEPTETEALASLRETPLDGTPLPPPASPTTGRTLAPDRFDR
jgi:hypothetical protein